MCARSYPWDAAFSFTGFRSHIDQSNVKEASNWVGRSERLVRHGVVGGYELSDSVQRISFAPTLELLLQPEHDLRLLVVLPCNFAVYANDLIGQAQASAGLKERKILEPAISGYNFLGTTGDEKEGLFIWCVGPDIMWQKLDRRIDEYVFELSTTR